MPYSKKLAMNRKRRTRLRKNFIAEHRRTGMTVAELAESMGVTPTYIYALEQDNSKEHFNLPFLIQAAKIFGNGSFNRMMRGVVG